MKEHEIPADYRKGVGIVIQSACRGKVLWCKRAGEDGGWQFPQGGLDDLSEPIADAAERELYEETGLTAKDYDLISITEDWTSYSLQGTGNEKVKGKYTGQAHRWALVRLKDSSLVIDVAKAPVPVGEELEFEDSRWVAYWYPLHAGDMFELKRRALTQALRWLAPAAFG